MDIATIGLKVDATGVVSATDKLEDFTAAGAKAEAASKSLGTQATKTAAQVKGVAEAAGKATPPTVNLGNATRKQAQDFNAAGISAGQYRQAMRQLPSQITDIVTSLASGQSPFIVAIQQGGQLKDSFGGVVPAARAMVGALGPVALGLSAAAAVAGVFAIGLIKGEAEVNSFNQALILTGQYSGVTAGQLGLMADSISDIVGTRGKAAEVLSELVSTGRIGGDNLQYFAKTAIEAERTLGIATAAMAKNFSDLAKDPVTASLRLNETLHYLTAATYEQIQAQIKAGDATGAATTAQNAYSDAINSRKGEVLETLGAYARAWQRIKDAASGAVDAAFNNRPPSDEDRLAALTANRGSRALGATSLGDRGDGPGRAAAFAAADREERELRARVTLLRQGAEAQAEFARRTQEGLAAQQTNLKISESFLTNQQKLNKAVKEYRDNEEKKRLGGFAVDSPEQQARVIAGLNAQFKTSTLDSDVAGIQRNLNQVVTAYDNAGAALDAQRGAQRISDADYYAQKNDLIRKTADAEIAALQAENARIGREKAINEEAIRNQDKIKDNLAKIAVLRANAANQGRILAIQEEADQEKLGKAANRSGIAGAQRELQAQAAAYANAERIFEAQRAAGLVKDRDYYDAKKQFVRDNTDAQARAIEQEIARLSTETAIGAERIALDDRIADARERLNKTRADGAAAEAVLDTQKLAANKAIERSFAQASAAAEEYQATLNRTYDRDLADFGAGPAARRYSAGVNNIEDRFLAQKTDLESQRRAGAFDTRPEAYERERALIEAAQLAAVEGWNSAYDRIEARQREFGEGFKEAFLSYADSMRNVGANLGGDLVSALDQAQAAASDLAAANLLWGEGGKEAAKEVARDLLTQTVSAMIRTGAQAAVMYGIQKVGILTTTSTGIAATQAAATAQVAANAEIAASAAPAAGLTSLATFGANSVPAILGIGLVSAAIGALLGGAFADGGDPPVGKVSLVGERGPELFIPKGAGTIIPNGAWSQAGGTPMGSNPGGGTTIINNAPGITITPRAGRVYVEMLPEWLEMAVEYARDAVGADIDNSDSDIGRSLSGRIGTPAGVF